MTSCLYIFSVSFFFQLYLLSLLDDKAGSVHSDCSRKKDNNEFGFFINEIKWASRENIFSYVTYCWLRVDATSRSIGYSYWAAWHGMYRFPWLPRRPTVTGPMHVHTLTWTHACTLGLGQLEIATQASALLLSNVLPRIKP